MSSGGQNTNNNQAGVIPAGDPNQVIPAGTVGVNPQSTLNPNVPHTKADLDNHSNQLNPNNPRYSGHQERLAAEEAAREAAVLHQQAQAAYQYANQMEATAIQAQQAAAQLSQQATFCAQQASAGLSNRGGHEEEQQTSDNAQQSTGGNNQALPQRQTNQS
ncbi:unnamed protein product [Adineta steineri]|uniref:Uncharacterized protein n=1 Tax=Adineta steineri TaxID=433720 RepID=A0A813REV9_9BILA|nr:unnamed protein product [Adineta steineri]